MQKELMLLVCNCRRRARRRHLKQKSKENVGARTPPRSKNEPWIQTPIFSKIITILQIWLYQCFLRPPPWVRTISRYQKGTPNQRGDPSESWFYHSKTTIIIELRFFFGKNTPGSLRGRDRSGVGPVLLDVATFFNPQRTPKSNRNHPRGPQGHEQIPRSPSKKGFRSDGVQMFVLKVSPFSFFLMIHLSRPFG